MFKKILFFVILAGIGFGIYTGIHKIFEVVSAPKTVITTGTTISIVTTGSDISETGSLSGNIAEESTGTVEETLQAPGWFSRTWTSIKTWFSSKRESVKEDEIATTGNIVPEPSLSGEVISGEVLTWKISTGNIIEDSTATGTEVEEVVHVIIDTWVITTKAPTTPTVVSKPTTTKTTTTVKKPTTTSWKDPILDALFR